MPLSGSGSADPVNFVGKCYFHFLEETGKNWDDFLFKCLVDLVKTSGTGVFFFRSCRTILSVSTWVSFGIYGI
jgi:hypothetical protein